VQKHSWRIKRSPVAADRSANRRRKPDSALCPPPAIIVRTSPRHSLLLDRFKTARGLVAFLGGGRVASVGPTSRRKASNVNRPYAYRHLLRTAEVRRLRPLGSTVDRSRAATLAGRRYQTVARLTESGAAYRSTWSAAFTVVALFASA
jgi:hypothetical protein